MSNLESPAAAAERGAAEREPAAASVPASDVTPKHKKKKKMKVKNKMQEQQESPPDLDSAEPAEVEDQGEVKGRRMEELETTDAAASALKGTPKCKKKKKKKKTKKKKNMMQEQQESPPDLDSTALAEAEYQGEAKGRGMEELEATDAAGSALNGTSKCKKKKNKNKMQKQQESPHELDSTAPAEAEYQGESKATRMEELEATNAAASAWNGTPKCKKMTKKKNKVQEQQECSHELDSTTAAEAEEQGGTKGRGMEELLTTDASASALNGTPKGKKKKKKMKKNNMMQEQQESPPELNSTAAAEDEELEEAKGRGMKEREVTNATASTLDGTPKCKKTTKKNNNEQKETPPDLDSTAAAEAEEQEETKGRGMEEQEATDAAASVFEGTLKCDDEDAKVNDSVMLEAKVKDSAMLKEEATGTVVSAFEGTPQSKKRKRKNMTQKEPESIPASLGVVGVNKIVSNKSENGCVDGVEASGHTDVSMDPINGKDSVMLKEETIGTVVSASEGTPQLKRKRKNKMQKQPESEQALSDVVVVNKIVSNKSENCCSDGVVASGHADVSMDPINGEDPSCAQSKANVAGVLVENCSENSSLLQESSAGSKRRKRKRKRGSPNRWSVFSSENGEMVGKHSLDSSTHHDLSCASCLVEACKEKIKNIYSPRGSLVRFQRKKLLILDLNGLLADINQDFHNAHKAHGKVRGKLVFRRPYSDDFLRFCFQNFELGIWSSRKRENVDSVVNILMKDLKKYLLFCWDMSYCTVTGCNTVDNKHKPLVLKELKKLWNKEEPTLPWELGEFSPSNTLLVDDSPYKALCNPPNTAIFPQPYSYRNKRDDYSLGPGGDLRIYLERIASADDVQSFVRDNPFGQNSITESDPNWNFYVQIVDKVEKRIVDKVENQIVDTVKQIDVKMKKALA